MWSIIYFKENSRSGHVLTDSRFQLKHFTLFDYFPIKCNKFNKSMVFVLKVIPPLEKNSIEKFSHSVGDIAIIHLIEKRFDKTIL